jgi:hypothetical protein
MDGRLAEAHGIYKNWENVLGKKKWGSPVCPRIIPEYLDKIGCPLKVAVLIRHQVPEAADRSVRPT